MYEPWPRRTYPPAWRVVLAFLLAPGAAALLFTVLIEGYPMAPDWPAYAKAAYAIAIGLGLPAYFMLRRHLSPRPVACAITGFVVAALPWVLLVAIGSDASSASTDGRATVIAGQTTAYGWLLNAQFILTIGLFGAVGGFLFWAIAAAGHRPEPTSS